MCCLLGIKCYFCHGMFFFQYTGELYLKIFRILLHWDLNLIVLYGYRVDSYHKELKSFTTLLMLSNSKEIKICYCLLCVYILMCTHTQIVAFLV